MLNIIAKTTLFLGLTLSSSYANNLNLRGDGVKIKTLDQNDEEVTFIIKRNHNSKCQELNGADPKTIWSGDFARKDIINDCKKTFVTTVGKISPMRISPKIETVGEVEVINFIKAAQTDESLLLIDARTPAWFNMMTIPTSTNVSFKLFNPKHIEFEDTLETLGVEVEDGKYDFSEAKTLTIFCNGSWCLQSLLAIKNLKKIGYPQEKLKWYRGGMYSWKMLNLTTIKP